MRPVHWLLSSSAALFVGGMGFVLVSTGTSRPEASQAPAKTSVRQLMRGVVQPAATVVFQSVSTTITLEGTVERYPRNDDEWKAVENSASALIEAGKWLMMGRRVVNKNDWVGISQQLSDAAGVALKAAQAKDVEGLFASGEGIYLACDACHQNYMQGP